MTYVAKGAGAGLSKIGDIAKGLKGVGTIDIPQLPENAITLPEGSLKLPDGTVHLPEGSPIPQGATKLPDGRIELPHDVPVLPEGTTKLPSVDASPARYMDPHGNLLDHQGNVVQHADQAPTDFVDRPTTGSDAPHTSSPVKEPAMATAGTHTVEQAGEHVRLGSTGHDLGDISRSTDEASAAHTIPEGGNATTVHAGADAPAVHGAGEGVPGDHVPGDHAGDHVPGGRADDAAPGPHPAHAGDHGGTRSGGHTGDSTTSHTHQQEPAVSHGDHASSGGDHPLGDSGGHEHAPGGDSGVGADALPPHGGDLGDTGAALPDEPRGNLPDGSWAGENGLRLDPEANAAADEFMRRSREAEPHITASMQDIAGRVDDGKLIGLEYRLKGEDSLKRKLATDMLEDIGMDHGAVLGDIKDSIRYTLEVPADNYTHGVRQTIDDLQAKGFENVTFKNTWDSAGYKGINSTWRDPVSGQVFELQFHTADSFAAKMDGHVLYEKERLPGVTPEELASIKAEQAELFGRVPVPHGAGNIRLGTHGVDDMATWAGRNADTTAGHAGSHGGDAASPPHTGHEAPADHTAPGDHGTHDPAHEAEGSGTAGHGDDTEHTGDQDGAPGDSPYTDGPHGGWSGAGWVEKPDPINDPDSVVAAEMYENIRATDNKVELPAISRHTGVDEAVLRQVKSHLFRAQHEVAIGPDTFKRGLFTPRRDIGELWYAAREGKLSEEGVQQFKHLMAHEYVESRLMKSGLPYIRAHEHLWELDPSDGRYYRPQFPRDVRDAGAHDLAPSDKNGSFRHWRSLEMEPPKVELADDLSNIDDLVKAIQQQLRQKGMDL
jgi:hypothetical protein